MFGLDVSMKMS